MSSSIQPVPATARYKSINEVLAEAYAANNPNDNASITIGPSTTYDLFMMIYSYRKSMYESGSFRKKHEEFDKLKAQGKIEEARKKFKNLGDKLSDEHHKMRWYFAQGERKTGSLDNIYAYLRSKPYDRTITPADVIATLEKDKAVFQKLDADMKIYGPNSYGTGIPLTYLAQSLADDMKKQKDLTRPMLQF